MRFGLALLPAFLLIGFVSAQQAPLSGPLEAFTFDVPTRSIRPVIGSLGSASLGQPILRTAYGSVAPHQNYALTFEGDRCTLVLGLGSNQGSAVEIAGSFVLPEGVAWSGDGSTAILYSRTGNWIQVVSGLPGAANTGLSLSLSVLGGTLTSVAADFRGEHIAIGLLGEAGGVYQVANGGIFVSLLSGVKPIALSLAGDGKTLYTLDSATGQIFEQNMADLSFQAWPVDGLADAVALVSTKDTAQRGVIYVAGRNDHLLKVFDASTHEVLASVPLNFQPNAIEPLGRGSFLLGSRVTTDDIFWSFTNAPQPTVYFVPAIPLQLREKLRR